MSYDNIYNFYKRALEEKKFSEDFIEKLKVISSENELKQFIETRVCPIARNMGYDFTVEDLLSYEIETAKRLSEEELESISGGVGVKQLIFGGIVSLFTVGGGVMLSNVAHAELDSQQVLQSLQTLKEKVQEVDVISKDSAVASAEQTSMSEADTKMQDRGANKASVQAEDENVRMSDFGSSEVGKEELEKDTTQAEDERGLRKADQRSRDDQLTTDTTENSGERDLERGLKTEVTEASTAAKDRDEQGTVVQVEGQNVTLSAAKSIDSIVKSKLTDAQKFYVTKALNMQDAFALLQSGMIEKFRKCLDISLIKLDEKGKRLYADDVGGVISEVLCQLYPSTAGQLSTESNNKRFYLAQDHITPEEMAKIFSILNDYRNGNIICTNDAINVSIKDKEKAYFLDSNKNLGGKDFCDTYLKGLDSKRQSTLIKFARALFHFVDECEPANQMKNIDSEISRLDGMNSTVDQKKKTFIGDFIGKLVAIKENLQAKEQSIYPEYFLDKILMSYMVKTLSTSDEVERFYSSLVDELSKNKSKNMESKEKSLELIEENGRLEKLNEVIDAIKLKSLSPFKNATQAHGATYIISKQGDNVTFLPSTFQDCTEMAVRNLINLVGYREDPEWNLFLKDADIKDLNESLKKVIDAINNKGLVELFNFKKRLQMYFLYQRGFEDGLNKEEYKKYRSSRGVDDTSNISRTLWAYAVSNMNQESLKKGRSRFCFAEL